MEDLGLVMFKYESAVSQKFVHDPVGILEMRDISVDVPGLDYDGAIVDV